jgi:hypothetical protein
MSNAWNTVNKAPRKRNPKKKGSVVYNENDEGKDNWSDFDLFVFDELGGAVWAAGF